jgi:hypothetical protein
VKCSHSIKPGFNKDVNTTDKELPMTDLVPREDRGLDQLLDTWRDRRQLTEARTQARLDEFREYAEARRRSTRMHCAGELADQAAVEHLFRHHRFTGMAAGDAVIELDLRDFERVVKLGCEHLIYGYFNWR